MKILIIGEEQHFEEFRLKFGKDHEFSLASDHRNAEKILDATELVFDFIIDEFPDQFEIYIKKNATVFLNTTKLSLSELTHQSKNNIKCTLFGFNGLPTFLNKNIFEVCMRSKSDETRLRQICEQLKTEFLVVEDRVGLVTPRVISMIINEAYYAVQEGTATREDIDLAMKLGTNYPFGPFEWATRIGIKHIYELLEALYEDTRDERYKICPLLKKEYLKTV
jgi:3-hydroxybutyryl-CoA dehydrogenase